MQRLPWLVFDNLASRDLNKIFLNANVHIKDDSLLSDGSGLPKYITIIDLTNLGGTIATIADLLLATSQWLEMFPSPHGYIAKGGSGTFTPDASITTNFDFFDYTFIGDATLSAMIGANPGDTGTIVIHKNSAVSLTWDTSYYFPLGEPVMTRLNNVFEYKVLVGGRVQMDFIQDDEDTIVTSTTLFSYTGSAPTITGAYDYSSDGFTWTTGTVPTGSGTYQIRSNAITAFAFAANTTSVAISKLNTTDVSGMFAGCVALTSINTNSIDFTGVTNFDNMFNGCTALTCHGNIDTTSATSVTDMYTNCTALTSPTTTEQSNITAGTNWTSPGCP